MALNFGSIFNKVRDVFDANTEEDQRKRLAMGQQRFYQDQQRQAPNLYNQGLQTGRGLVSATVNPVAKAANTVSAGLAGAGRLGNVGFQSIFGNDQSYLNARQELSRGINTDYAPGSGFASQGTFFDGKNDLALHGDQLAFNAKVGTTAMQLAPYAVTGPGGKVIVQQGLSAVPRIAGFNAAQSALGSAGSQLNDTGTIDPKQFLMDTATGTAVGTGGSLLFAGGSKLTNKKAPVALKTYADNFDQPHSSANGKFVSRSEQELAAEVAASKARAADPNVQAKRAELNPEVQVRQAALMDTNKTLAQRAEQLKPGSQAHTQVMRQIEANIAEANRLDTALPVRRMGESTTFANDIPKSWLKPKTEGDKALSTMVNEAADALDSFKKETGGVSLIPGENGNKVRASANPKWYQDFYAKNGRAPNKGELKTIAYNMLENKDPQITNLVDAELYHATKQMAQEAPKATGKPKVTAKSNPNVHIPTDKELATGGVTPENMAAYNAMDKGKPKVKAQKVKTPSEPTVVTGNPTKHPAVKEVLQALSTARGKSNVEASLTSAKIEAAARKLKVNLKDKNFLDNYETGNLTGNQAKLAAIIKSETEKTFELQQQITPDILHRENYIPHSYAQGDEAVQEAARRLQTATGADKSRTFNTYAEARDYGLAPKRDNLAQIIGENTKSAHTALLNRDVVKKGLENGIFDTSPTGRTPVTGLFHNGDQIYAQKSVADTLNGVLQKDSTGLAKVTRKAAGLSEKAQDVMLQGGIPGTNANFFVAGQLAKDSTRNIGKALLLRPIQAVKQEGHLLGDFFRGKKGTIERFAKPENAEFVRQMADRGLDITPQTAMSGVSKGKVSKVWDSLGNNPTFGRYMPNRLLSTAQEVYSQSVKKLGHEKALDLAAETTKKFTGQVDQIAKGRSNLTQDAIGAVAFAPKYRARP